MSSIRNDGTRSAEVTEFRKCQHHKIISLSCSPLEAAAVLKGKHVVSVCKYVNLAVALMMYNILSVFFFYHVCFYNKETQIRNRGTCVSRKIKE